MSFSSCARKTKKCVLAGKTNDIEFLIRVIGTTGRSKTCFRGLSFGIESSGDGGVFFDGMLVRFKLLSRSSAFDLRFNVFSFELLPHHRYKELFSKLIDHFEFIIP